MKTYFICHFLLSFYLFSAVVKHQNNEVLDVVSKIELSVSMDLPPLKSINTKILLNKRDNGSLVMELLYEMETEWDKPYKIDKKICCKIDHEEEYEALWTSLKKENVFELRELNIGNAEDALLFSDLPAFSAPTIYFSFVDGQKENQFACRDIKMITGDKRYMAVLRLLKDFVEKFHCNKEIPNWLSNPFAIMPNENLAALKGQ